MDTYYAGLLKEFSLPLTNPVLVFSLVLFIILLSPVILRKINIPGTVGLILSGVAIGPHALNLLEKSSAVDLFSTIGLLYIMFIAGLELDVGEFRRHRHKSILFGMLTFALPIAIGYPVCRYLLNYGVTPSVLTASMFATHTLVAYPIVSRMGISKNQAVAVTVGGTILTDTAVLIILAVVTGFARGDIDHTFWIRLSVSLAIFAAIVFLLLPALARWFFSKLESEKHSHYIFVLAAVFFSAFLAKLAGVEPIIGAFAAGLALNPLIPNSSALMNRIEFIGNSLFIPFFLISVGMLVDVRVLLNGPMAMLIAVTLTVVALAGKWVAAFAAQKLFGYSNAQRGLMFGLSSSHAAATIAIILVGYQSRILDLNILNGTVILILVTCIVASLVTDKAARVVVMDETAGLDEGARDHEENQEQILLPVLTPGGSERLLELALMIKERRPADSLTLLVVVPNDDEAEANVLKARKSLEPMVRHAASFDTVPNVVATIDKDVPSGVVRATKELSSNLILCTGLADAGDHECGIVTPSTKTLFMCRIQRPLAMHRRILVACPPHAEREKGFSQWLLKIGRLAIELGAPIIIHCDRRTRLAMGGILKKAGSAITVHYRPFRSIGNRDDGGNLAATLKEDDLLVVISSRSEPVPYRPLFDAIREKLEGRYDSLSTIMVCPARFELRETEVGIDEVVRRPMPFFGRAALGAIGRLLGETLKKAASRIKGRLAFAKKDKPRHPDP